MKLYDLGNNFQNFLMKFGDMTIEENGRTVDRKHEYLSG